MEGRQRSQVNRMASIVFGPEERACAERLIDLALAEDLGFLGDVTALATIPSEAKSSGFLVARAPGVLSGMPVVDLLAQRFALDSWHLESDGLSVEKGAHI